MPTYEYACTSCGHHVEMVQSFSDEPLTVCPDCGGTLRKVFAPVGIVLKGSGFYKTDSRATGKGAKSGSGRGDGDSSSSGADSATGGSPAPGAGKGAGGDKSDGASGSSGTGSGKNGGGTSAGKSAPAAATSS